MTDFRHRWALCRLCGPRRFLATVAAVTVALGLGSGSALYAQRVEQGVAIVSEAIASRVDGFSYRPDSTSELEFRGTALATRATGKIKVRTTSARTEIDARFEHMPAAASLGPFAVYVLWVITAEGQPHNVGSPETITCSG